MENFTLSCTNDECSWEEDNEYEELSDAKEDAGASSCPKCYSELKVI